MSFETWRLTIRTRVTPVDRPEEGHHRSHSSSGQHHHRTQIELGGTLSPRTETKLQKHPLKMPDSKPTIAAPPRPATLLKTASPSSEPKLCMHIVTYGQSYNRIPRVKGAETINTINCACLIPPPASVCRKYTGLDAAVADDFFRHKGNQAVFEQKLREIEAFLAANPMREGCVAVMVSCVMGVHRSVAMAERLAFELRRRNGIKVETKHLDRQKWVERMRKEGREEMELEDTKKKRTVAWARGS
jgi:predicted protein tyrosine phosphatase